MKTYRVTQLVRFGAGTVLMLSATQIAARRHALAVPEGAEGGGEVTANLPVQFKTNEVIGVGHTLSRAEQDALAEAEGAVIGAPDEGEGGRTPPPVGDDDAAKTAAAKAAAEKTAAAKAGKGKAKA